MSDTIFTGSEFSGKTGFTKAACLAFAGRIWQLLCQ